MNIILRKARKDFKKLGWRKHLIIGVIISCLGTGLGLFYAIVATLPTINLYFDNVNRADYTYQLGEYGWATQDQLDGLKDIDGVEAVSGRLFWRTHIKLPNQEDRKYLLLVGLDPADEYPEVYNYTIIKGTNFNAGEERYCAVIDKTFAEVNEVDIGDLLSVDGLHNARLKISGTCVAPEFMGMTSYEESILPMEGSMAVVFLSKTTLKKYIVRYLNWMDSETTEDTSRIANYYQKRDFNNIAVKFKEGVNQDETNQAIIKYLKDDCHLNLQKAEKFEDSSAYSLMESDVRDTGEILMMILGFMALMSALIVYIIFNRYVYSQEQQIGFLLGLGYTKKDIMKYFLFNIGIISITSIPTGIFLGYAIGYLMTTFMLTELANVAIFTFPFLFAPEVLYVGLILGISVVFFSTYFSVRKINRKIIAELIYQQEEVHKKVQKIKKKYKKTWNILNRLVTRNLFRNRKRFIFTMITMTFSLLIVSASQSLVDSMYYNLNRTFETPNNPVEPDNKWDMNVDFQRNIKFNKENSLVEKIEKIDGVKDTRVYTKGLVRAQGKEDQDLILVGMDFTDEKYHRFTWYDSNENNSAPKNKNEIVIPSVYAIKLDKKIGDKLVIEYDDDDADALVDEYTFTIVGIHAELMMCAYVNFEGGKTVFYDGINRADGVFILLEDGANREEIKDKIYDMKNIEIIFDAKEMNENLLKFLENYLPFMQLMEVFTFMVSFFIVFYNSVMNVYDKNYEYGILRSLGYSKTRVYKLILIENILQGLFPIILALLFTYPLTLEMGQAYQEDFPLEITIGLPTIVMIIIPPLVLYVLGSFLGLRTVYKQNLYEQVQTKFVG